MDARSQVQAMPPAAAEVLRWIFGGALRCAGIAPLVEGFGERLVEAGVPVGRLVVSVRVLTATVLARTYRWRAGEGLSTDTFDWADRDAGLYERSPFKSVHETRQWVDLKLSDTPDEVYGIVPELRAAGITHYLAVPLEFANGTVNAMTVATGEADGFSDEARAVLRAVLPGFTAALELRALDSIMREVLAIYVGAEPARRILSGTVHRGEINRISSAIMFVDMRDFTRRTQAMSAADTAELLNRYYDCVVPHVEAHGGSVLKFIGDGILAIFPDGEAGPAASTAAALSAAQASLAAVPGACSNGRAAFEMGIALHHGEAAFGNVGSGERLDFTVVGRDVNLTDRVGRLNKKLAIPLLLSEAFCRHLGGSVQSCGHHAVASFDEVIEVFQPV